MNFEAKLKGGHPNSLGNTVEVVNTVLDNPELFEELFNCYFSNDEVVRLRVSNAIKRIVAENKLLLLSYIDRFLNEISKIEQASAQWTLAQLFKTLGNDMAPEQISRAKSIMKDNLANSEDWIVLNQTMATLTDWSKNDENLKEWLIPHLERLTADKRKSVSGRAGKMLKSLS